MQNEFNCQIETDIIELFLDLSSMLGSYKSF